MRIPEELKTVVATDPEILGGTPCFAGTRVPLTTLFDYIGSGFSLARFLKGYPSVSHQQAMIALEWQAQETRRLLDLEVVA